MKQLGCLRASVLLDRRAAGLSAAEALRLEEHLAGCERCSRDAQLLGGLRAISHDIDGTLAPHVRARVIEGAVSQVQARRAAIERSRVHASLRIGAAFAAAALLVFALRAVLTPAPQPVASSVRVAPALVEHGAETGDRVLDGAVEVGDRVIENGAALSDGASMHASTDARIALAHANIELHAGSDVRWQRAAHVLRLDAGSVVADVDPSVHQPFVIETARFRVLVLGTRFEVTLDGVRVERGRVRVVAPDGSVLVPLLDAGEQYSWSEAAAAPRGGASISGGTAPALRGGASMSDTAPALRGGASMSDTAPALRGGASIRERARGGKSAPRADAARLIDEARAQLGRRQVARARQAIDAALALAPEARLRAEALTLRGECALVDGDQGAAVEAYLRVARAYADLPAGENALFAAARLEADRQRSAAAAQLLDRYLERYPHGRFEREARGRLHSLSATLDRAQ